ncbi:MAG: 4Fe-4S cluster-binding domain-containing protein, partial [Thermodesulfobacteriota bacterium]|nr:4Fe-4S cluster-binding domain-containing protein [Thermodesulfobacteriota bacterium]
MTWKKQLKESTRSIDQLKRHIAMDKDEERVLREVVDAHPMCIPPYYMSLINPSDPDDPIRAMSVPCMDEQDITGSYDTSGEGKNTKMEGLQHKYSQTALLLATNQCAMYCRHCFRKRMVGIKETEQLKHYNEAAQYIEKHREINNVLITGGDPFVMSTSMIAELLDMISPIDHLDFIRFGTRIPVSLPQRIIEDPSLIALLNRHSRPER